MGVFRPGSLLVAGAVVYALVGPSWPAAGLPTGPRSAQPTVERPVAAVSLAGSPTGEAGAPPAVASVAWPVPADPAGGPGDGSGDPGGGGTAGAPVKRQEPSSSGGAGTSASGEESKPAAGAPKTAEPAKADTSDSTATDAPATPKKPAEPPTGQQDAPPPATPDDTIPTALPSGAAPSSNDGAPVPPSTGAPPPEPGEPAPPPAGSPPAKPGEPAVALDPAQRPCTTPGPDCAKPKPAPASAGGTTEEDPNAQLAKLAGHTALDGVGMVPGVGTVANGINAIWYAAEGDWENAALSGVGMVPGAGMAAGAAKLAAAGGAAKLAAIGAAGGKFLKDARATEEAVETAGKVPTELGTDILENGTQWTATGRKGGKLPMTAEPNNTVYRLDQEGNISGYAKYGDDGCITMRYCTRPDAHGIEGDSHVHQFQQGANEQTGKVFTNEIDPRKTRPDERPYN